ncbi:hypothetical protein PENTCL1PPCAC_30564, partial [Pristionchus entomophagus]
MSAKRNLVAFWLLGLCNNFAYVIMLSAAKDILEKGAETPGSKVCNETITHRTAPRCRLAPSSWRTSFPPCSSRPWPRCCCRMSRSISGTRRASWLQASAFITVAVSDTAYLALTGVAMASFGSGPGRGPPTSRCQPTSPR